MEKMFRAAQNTSPRYAAYVGTFRSDRRSAPRSAAEKKIVETDKTPAETNER